MNNRTESPESTSHASVSTGNSLPAATPTINVLPASSNPIYEQRETGITHNDFQTEYRLFQYIRLGNVPEVKKALQQYMEHGFVIGKMSSDALRLMKYWAVSSIANSIHYAILGGLDETDAFNLSDEYIRHVDAFTTPDGIIPYLTEKALDLTYLVYKSKFRASHSPAIRRCLHYIHLHLHEKITIDQLATLCHLSCDYLSVLFKSEVGQTIHRYISFEKLEASKVLLLEGHSYSSISYDLGFCTESHYIACFKKEYGITPGQYLLQQY